MYIWIGCGLPQTFETGLRSHCLRLNESFHLNTVPFSLPQHISLKISFDGGDRAEDILAFLTRLLSAQASFFVELAPAQVSGSILWLPARDSEQLSLLHTLLDQELFHRFGIGQHPFDRDFRFHSTLFFGDPGALAAIAEAVNALALPRQLKVDHFLLGVSETGQAGTYRVVQTIPAKD